MNRHERRKAAARARRAKGSDTMGASYSTGGQIPEHIRNSPHFKRAAKEGLPPEYFAFIETLARHIFEWVQAEPTPPDLKWHQTDANRTIITGALDAGAAYLANSPDAFRLLAWLDEKTEHKASIYQVTWALRLVRALPMPDGSYHGVETVRESLALKGIETFVRDYGKEETRMAASVCPRCGAPNDAATGTESGARPNPGDFAVCMTCLAVNTFDVDLRVQAVTDEEFAELPAAIRAQLEDMQAIVRAAGSRGKRKGPVAEA